MVTMVEWASFGMYKHYASNEGAAEWRGRKTVFDVAWRVPQSFIESLFSAQYWAEAIAQECNADPARALKIAGWVFDSNEEGAPEPALEGDAMLPKPVQKAFRRYHFGELE